MGIVRDIMKGVVIGLIVNVILFSLPYIAQSLGLNVSFNLFQMGVPLWLTILFIIIIIPTVVMVSRRRRRGYLISTSTSRRIPEYSVVNVECDYAGVKWKVLYGRASPYRRKEPYAFCFSNPRCPECNYDMESEKRGWILKHDIIGNVINVANSIDVRCLILMMLMKLLKDLLNQTLEVDSSNIHIK